MRRVLPLVLLGLAAALVAIAGQEATLGLRLAFLVAGAAPIGALVLGAAARLVGADWSPLQPLARPLSAAAIVGVIALNFAVVPLPPHLARWSWPALAALRALLVLGALLVAAHRLPRAGVTAAGLGLAAYAVLVTPVAADWLLGTAPGQPVSAIGMMLAVQQIGAACALVLLLDRGPLGFRRDMTGLLVAAALGLSYLAFMDYLIVWYGNLPARVPFYLGRANALPVLALAIGLGGTIAAAATGRGRAAGASALAGIALFDTWWLAAGPLAVAVAVVAVVAIGLASRQARG